MYSFVENCLGNTCFRIFRSVVSSMVVSLRKDSTSCSYSFSISDSFLGSNGFLMKSLSFDRSASSSSVFKNGLASLGSLISTSGLGKSLMMSAVATE